MKKLLIVRSLKTMVAVLKVGMICPAWAADHHFCPADACHSVYQTATCDCDAIIRVQNLANTRADAMAGMLITAADGIRFTRRSGTGGTTRRNTSTLCTSVIPHETMTP